MPDRPVPPTKEEIAALPPFERLELDRIRVVATREEIDEAFAELSRCKVVGFDTESRPTFRKGQISDGPHLVQFSTNERAYLFQLHRQECHEVVGALLNSTEITKVGFGLGSDRTHLTRKFGAEPKGVLDLTSLFKKQGYRNVIGVKSAVAIVFQQRFSKSGRATTSNWANERLTVQQLIYAANDAYAALLIYQALEDRPTDALVAVHDEGKGSAERSQPVAKEPMEFDTDKIDQDVLALLFLTSFRERPEYSWRAWKSQDWDVLDRLHKQGLIYDPKGKAKSIVFTEEGFQKAKALFEAKYRAR